MPGYRRDKVLGETTLWLCIVGGLLLIFAVPGTLIILSSVAPFGGLVAELAVYGICAAGVHLILAFYVMKKGLDASAGKLEGGGGLLLAGLVSFGAGFFLLGTIFSLGAGVLLIAAAALANRM